MLERTSRTRTNKTAKKNLWSNIIADLFAPVFHKNRVDMIEPLQHAYMVRTHPWSVTEMIQVGILSSSLPEPSALHIRHDCIAQWLISNQIHQYTSSQTWSLFVTACCAPLTPPRSPPHSPTTGRPGKPLLVRWPRRPMAPHHGRTRGGHAMLLGYTYIHV